MAKYEIIITDDKGMVEHQEIYEGGKWDYGKEAKKCYFYADTCGVLLDFRIVNLNTGAVIEDTSDRDRSIISCGDGIHLGFNVRGRVNKYDENGSIIETRYKGSTDYEEWDDLLRNRP